MNLRARVRRASHAVARAAGHPGRRHEEALQGVPDDVADAATAALDRLDVLDGPAALTRARARDRANARRWPHLMAYVESLPVNPPESPSDPDWLTAVLPVPGPAALADARRVLDAPTPPVEADALAHCVVRFWAHLTLGLSASTAPARPHAPDITLS